MNPSHEALQARVAVLGELNRAELDASRLAGLLNSWVHEAFGLAAEVELAEPKEADPSAERMGTAFEPEVTPTHWRFPLVHRGRRLGRLSIAIPPDNPDAVCPTVVQGLVHEFSRLLDQAR